MSILRSNAYISLDIRIRMLESWINWIIEQRSWRIHLFWKSKTEEVKEWSSYLFTTTIGSGIRMRYTSITEYNCIEWELAYILNEFQISFTSEIKMTYISMIITNLFICFEVLIHFFFSNRIDRFWILKVSFEEDS